VIPFIDRTLRVWEDGSDFFFAVHTYFVRHRGRNPKSFYILRRFRAPGFQVEYMNLVPTCNDAVLATCRVNGIPLLFPFSPLSPFWRPHSILGILTHIVVSSVGVSSVHSRSVSAFWHRPLASRASLSAFD